MDAKKISLIIAAIILGAGVWYYVELGGQLRKNAGGRSNRAENEEPTSGFRLGTNAIYVPDQTPGQKVLVGFAALDESGFVVIREVDNEVSGAIIGASWLLSADGSGNIPPIALSREARHGEMLLAILYRDDGDGVFNPLKDLPITENGEPFAMQFMIDRNAAEAGEISL